MKISVLTFLLHVPPGVARGFKKWSDQEVVVVVCKQQLLVLIINGCVRLGTDLFNHSKGLFFNRALDKFLSASTICPFMFKSGRTFQMVGRTCQVKRRQRKRNKKGGQKRMGRMKKRRKKRKKK